LIELKNINKVFGEKKVLTNIDLSIREGEFIGLIGANGAGKSTLMKILVGLLPNYSGDFYLQNQKITKKTYMNVFLHTKALIETPQFFPHLTGYENIKYFTKLDGTFSKHTVLDALDFVNLYDAKDQLFRQYSLGMKQRLGIARIFASECNFMILDEPFNGLDPLAKEEIKNILKKLHQEGKTILVSSHLLDELETLSTRIIYLEQGAILHDIEWHQQQTSTFEISVDPVNSQNFQPGQFKATIENHIITVTIERQQLPTFLQYLNVQNITFYEVVNCTKNLMKYFAQGRE